MAFIGGSQLHGAKLEGTDDTDWYGVFIEPADKMLGLERDEFFVYTTGGKTGGNGPEDVDLCLYSLRKWAGMAAKGNPSALHFVFAKEQFGTEWWKRIVSRREVFASKRHVKPFLKFADDQMERPCGRKGQKNVHRAPLEEKHGYDTKYAMHVIRLYRRQGIRRDRQDYPAESTSRSSDFYSRGKIQAFGNRRNGKTARDGSSGSTGALAVAGTSKPQCRFRTHYPGVPGFLVSCSVKGAPIR